MTLKENGHLHQGLQADSSLQLAAAASAGLGADPRAGAFGCSSVCSHSKSLLSVQQPQINLKRQYYMYV